VALLAVVFVGVLAALVAVPVTRRIGHRAGWLLAAVPAGIAAWLAWSAPAVLGGEVLRFGVPWIPALDVALSFRLDGLSLLFALLISGIGAVILSYAGGYMAHDARAGRLHALLLLFMSAMLGVVLADDLLTLFLFWEATSVLSYLLVGFDHGRAKARSAALQALLVTGLGGLALLAAVVLIRSASGASDLSALLAMGNLRDASHLTAIVLLVGLAAGTKSAQFPFHFWLPNAMEAPTPVSAYLHSSTMVKAGIYLLARLTPVLEHAPLWQPLLIAAGAATMVVGAVLALRQTELKRLLAYSTVASLGTIVLALGVGGEAAVIAAFAFLLAHALYKATLFLVAGGILHETHRSDAEAVRGLARKAPILFAIALAAGVAMAGFPPTLAFIAKELLLEAFLAAATGLGLALAWGLAIALVGAAGCLLVVAAMVALRPFVGAPNDAVAEAHEPPPAMLLGPGLLATLGLAWGIAPWLGAEALIGGAARASLGVGPGAVSELHVGLWHGLTAALGLTALGIALGWALFAGRRRVRSGLDIVARPFDLLGPASAYGLLLDGMLRCAGSVTRFLQNGSLRIYTAVTLTTATIAAGIGLLISRTPLGPDDDGPPGFYVLAAAALIVSASILLATAKSRLVAVAALGIVGLGVASFFVIFGAPDLAMTQVAVDALTIVLMLAVFRRLPEMRTISGRWVRSRDACLALAAGAVMGVVTLYASYAQVSPSIAEELSRRSLPEGHGRNVVNVILVDFRALDTLGEISVVGMAALGVFALLRYKPRRPA
jgi:multicomponent Na+:H+ antiporter subunit A